MRCLLPIVGLISSISISELRAVDLNNPAPTHLKMSAGAFFTTNYLLELHDNGDLVYRTTKGDRGEIETEIVLHPSADKWRDFRSSLDRLNVWSWKGEYIDKAAPTDGFSWKLEVTYADRKIASHGYEAAPVFDGSWSRMNGKMSGSDSTFSDFLHAVSVLIDKPFG